jgi:hypothetical protein
MTSDPHSWEIVDGVLRTGAAPVLRELSASWSVVEDATGVGVFLRAKATESACFLELPLGRITCLKRFTGCHRYSPFWTKPETGSSKAGSNSKPFGY